MAKKLTSLSVKLPKPSPPLGRPPIPFQQEIADEICERLISGETLLDICETPHIPSTHTVYKWLSLNERFADEYARARDLAGHTFSDKAMRAVEQEPDPSRARLQFDAYRWLAGKLRPREYSDKHAVELTGANGGPIKTEVATIDAAALDNDAREQLRAALMATKKLAVSNK
jgi:hypothetical protein